MCSIHLSRPLPHLCLWRHQARQWVAKRRVPVTKGLLLLLLNSSVTILWLLLLLLLLRVLRWVLRKT